MRGNNLIFEMTDCVSRAHQRMVFSGIGFTLIFVFAHTDEMIGNKWLMMYMVILPVYFLTAMVQAWFITHNGNSFNGLERFLYVIDVPIVGYGLAVAGQHLNFMIPLLVVVALIRGLRYGPRALLLHSIAAGVILLLLYLFVDYWGKNPSLICSTLFLLAVLPVQFYKVCLKIHDSSTTLEEENLTDTLTRALNRKALDQALTHALYNKQDFALSFFDLDNFKVVNDTYGHSIGDKLLRRICVRLGIRLRAVDKVYRMSGDEFVVLSPGEFSLDVAQSLGQRIQDGIAEMIEDTCPNAPVSASVGVLLIGHDLGWTPTQVLHEADLLMYSAKKSGKNKVIIKDMTSSPPETVKVQDAGVL